MPAVSQLLLALAALSIVRPSGASRKIRRDVSQVPALVVAIGLGLVAAAFAATGLIPVTRCHSWERAADEALWTRGMEGRIAADGCFCAAALADPWSALPWRRRFELTDARDAVRSNESFEAAVSLLNEATVRDPLNFWGSRARGNLWQARWDVTAERDDARQAAVWLRRAAELYPTNATLLAELSRALEAGHEHSAAVEAARRALTQDEIYRKYGHVDRYLAEPVQSRLQRLVQESFP